MLPSSQEPARYQVLRYIGVDASRWDDVPATQSYPDFYTSMILYSQYAEAGVTDETAKDNLRDYSLENRGPVRRLLSSKTDNVTAVANISVTNPNLTVALPLFSATHASGLQLGNTWNTNFTASSVESPLFLISPNTAITVHLTAKISTDLQSQAASIALQAVNFAVKIAAPTSTLLTPLSSPDVNNKASAIDKAVSSLMSDSVSEDIEEGRYASSWTPSSVITLYGCAPFVRTEDEAASGSTAADARAGRGDCGRQSDLDGGGDTPIGKWFLVLACPRPSAFDPRDICGNARAGAVKASVDLSSPANLLAFDKLIAAEVDDGHVLDFMLSSQVDVRTFIQSQTWFTTFTSVKAPTAADYETFCTSAIAGSKDSLQKNGLSHLDAALALRAAIRQMPQLASLRADRAGKPANTAACVKLMNDAGVSF